MIFVPRNLKTGAPARRRISKKLILDHLRRFDERGSSSHSEMGLFASITLNLLVRHNLSFELKYIGGIGFGLKRCEPQIKNVKLADLYEAELSRPPRTFPKTARCRARGCASSLTEPCMRSCLDRDLDRRVRRW